jgi:hypothetical protein
MEKHQKPEQSHAKPEQSPTRKTGTPNLEYDLFSEMHSLLKGCSALEQYIEDAKEAGDREVESTFKALHEQNRESVTKLRDLIGKHLKAA